MLPHPFRSRRAVWRAYGCNRYAILPQDVTREELDQAFGPNVFTLNGSAWVVATIMATSSDVSDSLGFEPDQRSGVVFKIGEYYGRYDEALWQKLEAWKEPA